MFYYIMNTVELKLLFMVTETVPAQCVFIKNYLDRAQFIRPQGNDITGSQAFQRALCRMTVPVVPATGDYTETRLNMVKEMRGRRGFRTVMADFQHIRRT